MMAAEIIAVGMTTPVGLASGPTAAAVRAGIQRLNESNVYGQNGRPLVMGLLRDEHLPPIDASLQQRTALAPHLQRLLRLAGPALREALSPHPKPASVPVLVGFHEPCPELSAPPVEDFLNFVGRQAQVDFAVRGSKGFPQGRASGLVALEQALKLLSSDRRVGCVVVGGVDTYLAPELLARLDREGRLPTGTVTDGFIPGEGAGFLLLGRPGEARRLGREPLALLEGVATHEEKGHLYSAEPYLGEGLAGAFARLFEGLRAPPPVRCVYAGMNGESFWAKEWGVSYLRNTKRFAAGCLIEHPVQSFGDPGAALGPLLVGLAAISLSRGTRAGPCLVWCSSDREERGAALIQRMPGGSIRRSRSLRRK
jgi:3-oxoacyl-[acyl-carrier-protein] synthase-1